MKFSFTGETKVELGVPLRRISRTVNGVEETGGWIEKESNLDASSGAWVFGNAQVFGNAWTQSPLYIQGSRHALTLCSHTQIAIGCHVHTIAEWKKTYKAVGKAEGYTPEQIAEYGRHIAYIAKEAKILVAVKK